MTQNEANFNEAEISQQVLLDTVRTSFAMLNSIMVAQTIAAVVLFFAVGAEVPTYKIWIWAGYHLAALSLTSVMKRLFAGDALNTETAAHGGRWLTGFAVARSLSWALAALLFFPHLDLSGRTIFLAILCAMAIGAATTSITHFPAFVAFVVGALVPLAFMFALQDDSRSRALGIGLLLGWIMVLSAGRRLNAWLLDASASKLRLERTTAELQRKQREADASQHESETLRIAAEKSSLDKTRFLAAASHDLRQPMHSLTLYLEAARERNRDIAVGGLLQKVDQSDKSLDALFESLLDVSRLDSAAVTPRRVRFALNPMLQAIEARFAGAAKEKGITLRVRATASWALSDPALLERIISNLVSNAVRYTHSGGILVGVRGNAARLRIEVWDTGDGIPGEKFEEVFKEFVQLSNPERDRRKGLGLGLAIVERLSQLLDHPISLRSRVRQGTVFTVSLPCVRQPAATPAPVVDFVPSAQLAFPTPPSVLLIDDEVDTLEATMTALEHLGCAVYPAVSGADALDTFRKLHQSGTVPSVIVSDFRLADGDQNGLELILLLRKQSKEHVPAVLLTGDAALFDAFGKRDDVPKDVALVSKPASSAQLTAAIRRVISPTA